MRCMTSWLGFTWALAGLAACGDHDLGVPPAEAALRPERTVFPETDEFPCASAALSFAPPAPLLERSHDDCDAGEEGYCFALHPFLREVAAAADPARALGLAATALDAGEWSGPAPRNRFGRALADLAVTGGRAWQAFRTLHPQVDDVPGPASRSAKAAALERAYAVAWALRGPVVARNQLRPRLGWIAVSPEDDAPHRPVNIRSGFPQYDLTVDVAHRGSSRSVRTRVVVASTFDLEGPGMGWTPMPERFVGVMPPAPDLRLPTQGDLFLFIHGHASLAEEGAALIPALVELARQEGRDLTVVAMDHPSNAYADRVEASSLGAGDAVALDFLDAFLIGLVDTLEARQPGTADRIEALLGGSLGGNLVLRLAERDDLPWVRKVVAWSPASVDFSWSRAEILPFGEGEFLDLVKHEAVRLTRDASTKDERHRSRREYFTNGWLGVRTQAEYWYRDGWDRCKPLLIEEGLRQLSEVYDATFRRWHYRLAFEQLVFSHLEPGPDGVRPFQRIRAPLLLFTGEDDDGIPMSTWTFIERLAPHLTMPGETLFLKSTGHAMHSERPQLMAREILSFSKSPAGEVL